MPHLLRADDGDEGLVDGICHCLANCASESLNVLVECFGVLVEHDSFDGS